MTNVAPELWGGKSISSAISHLLQMCACLCLCEGECECSIPPKRGRKWISVWQHWLVHLDLRVLGFLMMMTITMLKMMTMLKMTRIMMMMCGSRGRLTSTGSSRSQILTALGLLCWMVMKKNDLLCRICHLLLAFTLQIFPVAVGQQILYCKLY